MFLGHAAVPILVRHYLGGESRPLVAGTLFPDAVDKALQQARLAENGRTIAHTLLAVIASTMAVRIFWGKKVARDWLLGYLGHLICDVEGMVPWFYPLGSYEFIPSSRNLWQKIKSGFANTSTIELLLLLWAIQVVLKRGDV